MNRFFENDRRRSSAHLHYWSREENDFLRKIEGFFPSEASPLEFLGVVLTTLRSPLTVLVIDLDVSLEAIELSINDFDTFEYGRFRVYRRELIIGLLTLTSNFTVLDETTLFRLMIPLDGLPPRSDLAVERVNLALSDGFVEDSSSFCSSG